MFLFVVCAAVCRAQAPPEMAYPTMGPLDRYMIADKDAEIALARSAAPASISGQADVMVLSPAGYITAVRGTNGFTCIVERGWANATDAPDFWNPKLRAPHCFNAAAAKTFLQVYLMKTRLILAGKSKSEALEATEKAFQSGELPPVASGAMVYMMSKQQYLGDRDKAWHPHLMFFVAGDAGKTWGANLPGSPVIAANDPQEHVTIFLLPVAYWSDGSPGPAIEF